MFSGPMYSYSISGANRSLTVLLPFYAVLTLRISPGFYILIMHIIIPFQWLMKLGLVILYNYTIILNTT